MMEFASALAVFALLGASSLGGLYVQGRLRAEHRSRETIELLQLVIGMLVTFSALVLGLLTNSAEITYEKARQDRAQYAIELAQLDLCLRNYGTKAEPARANLHSYTAAVIASTWPAEAPPSGVRYPDTAGMPRTGEDPVLARLMNRIGLDIHRLNPPDTFEAGLAESCLENYRSVLHARAAVVEDTDRRISTPFYRVLVFWLMIVFASFGLCTPRNRLALIVIVLAAVSVGTALFVISDLFRPYRGMFAISSDTMRAALAHMLAPVGSP